MKASEINQEEQEFFWGENFGESFSFQGRWGAGFINLKYSIDSDETITSIHMQTAHLDPEEVKRGVDFCQGLFEKTS